MGQTGTVSPAQLSAVVNAAIAESASPPTVAAALDHLVGRFPDAAGRLEADKRLRTRVVTVSAASNWLARLLASDPAALDVLEDLDTTPALSLPDGGSSLPTSTAREERAVALARWKQLEMLRIAARDLLAIDELEAVGAGLSRLANNAAAEALTIAGAPDSFAVIGMGKLGAGELNYSSDIDLILVGDGDVRPTLEVLRQVWRVDLDLRPEGRSGPIIRSLDSYEAYWDRWAETWEFQALLKARAIAGNRGLGAEFEAAASKRVWHRPFDADGLRQVRHMKARAEEEVAKAGLTDREIKRGRGGIRDVEFAVQLLQLVHGREDAALRTPATLDALAALARGGYVATDDALTLAEAYRFLRTVEHRLQLWEDQQVHAVPKDSTARERLARVLGFTDTRSKPAQAAFLERLVAHQAAVRAIHERLFFRPLLEAFTSTPTGGFTVGPEGLKPAPLSGSEAPRPPAEGLTPEATAVRLAAFGFSDAERTRSAVRELTRGLSRTSALMAQLLPRLLDWLSQSPDPDLGLLGLRSIADERHRREQLAIMCRESTKAARQLCLLLGTGPMFAREIKSHPDALSNLHRSQDFKPRSREQLDRWVERALAWRHGAEAQVSGLRHWKDGQVLRIAAGDILERQWGEGVGRELTDLAETVIEAVLRIVDPQVRFAVIGMGRLGGYDLAYASDLDVLFVYESEKGDSALSTSETAANARSAETAAHTVMKILNGSTPATRIYAADADLRPEGKQGPLARSLDAYSDYYARWAQTWERQALLRGRFIAGDAELGERFGAVASGFVWDKPLTSNDILEIRRMKARIEAERIPAGEDPQFHLKLGRGSLSDVEWTVQLLQLEHGVKSTSTLEALDALLKADAINSDDAANLREAYEFCDTVRNRLHLVQSRPAGTKMPGTDSLPSTGPVLTSLSRSMAMSPSDLRDHYRRVTRRSRRVVERLFYERPDTNEK